MMMAEWFPVLGVVPPHRRGEIERLNHQHVQNFQRITWVGEVIAESRTVDMNTHTGERPCIAEYRTTRSTGSTLTHERASLLLVVVVVVIAQPIYVHYDGIDEEK